MSKSAMRVASATLMCLQGGAAEDLGALGIP
jgi:hypothetical protein